jgi:hypothetical protein
MSKAEEDQEGTYQGVTRYRWEEVNRVAWQAATRSTGATGATGAMACLTCGHARAGTPDQAKAYPGPIWLCRPCVEDGALSAWRAAADHLEASMMDNPLREHARRLLALAWSLLEEAVQMADWADAMDADIAPTAEGDGA